jgi:hypothetical protein
MGLFERPTTAIFFDELSTSAIGSVAVEFTFPSLHPLTVWIVMRCGPGYSSLLAIDYLSSSAV